MYYDYTPDCHAADTVSALLLSHICEKVYVAEGMVDALAALRMASVSYEISHSGETRGDTTSRLHQLGVAIPQCNVSIP
ncbi:MAG: hypothetical protein OWQ51_13105 [Pyrobaculum arsenaticum]|nr:hypothetical protein [Pyrobaculum arsenaticum]MCY0891879.1 hypothetical protein [Pyrobaculum arsenaticum]